MSKTSLPPANVVCEGYVFTPVSHSVHRGGGVPGLRGVCSRGVPGPGGVPGLGASAPGGGVLGGDHHPPGRLLLRAVRILLECILVSHI